MDEASDIVWKALSDGTRRRVLDLLRERARTTGEVAAEFPGLSRYAVMKHLQVLVDAGLVVVRREGRMRWNHLNAVPLRAVYERWVGGYASAWAGALLALKHHVEQDGVEQEAAVNTGPGTGQGTEARSFRIEVEAEVQAPRARVFEALVRDTGVWFGPSSLEPWPGGRLYREDGAGAGELHGHVVELRPPGRLRLSLMPDPEGFAPGLLALTLVEEASRTRVHLEHRGLGGDDVALAARTERWRAGLEALRHSVESR